jgi:aspartyl-tRNA(Asn)/glutamyl-tRNA(Gln) amidotransferase subunit C
MSLSEQEVRHVAMLARLALTDDEVASLQTDLNSILGHIDTIQQLDLADVPPMTHAVKVVNETRADIVKPGLDRETALMNAPDQQDGAFLIPRIVGGGDDA